MGCSSCSGDSLLESSKGSTAEAGAAQIGGATPNVITSATWALFRTLLATGLEDNEGTGTPSVQSSRLGRATSLCPRAIATPALSPAERADLLNLAGANLAGANLAGANLACVVRDGAVVGTADLTGADLTGANLSFAKLSGADLTGANLTDAKLRVSDLTGANLTDAKLSGADLSCANLTDAVLTAAVLTAADLSGANFTGASLEHASLEHAILTKSTKFVNASVEGTAIDRYVLELLDDNYGGLMRADRLVMKIRDDVATLRGEFSGFMQWLHAGGILAFFAPYVAFTIAKTLLAHPYECGSTEACGPLLWALWDYVWTSQPCYEKGIFLFWAVYNAFRVALLFKTKKLEIEETARQLPVLFSFSGHKCWRRLFKFVHYGFWVHLIAVSIHLGLYMMTPVPQ